MELPHEHQVFAGREDEHLQLIELERLDPIQTPGTQTPGDVRVRASLRIEEFSGSYSEVWLGRPELERFVDDLRNLIEGGSERARLESLSPGELELQIRRLEAPGRFGLEVQMQRYRSTDPSTLLSGGFDVDEDQLPFILAGFETFL